MACGIGCAGNKRDVGLPAKLTCQHKKQKVQSKKQRITLVDMNKQATSRMQENLLCVGYGMFISWDNKSKFIISSWEVVSPTICAFAKVKLKPILCQRSLPHDLKGLDVYINKRVTMLKHTLQ
jgi:hypothetical protein